MSSVNPNPSVNQSVCGSDGGASNLACTLNAIGKWGTILTGVAQGKAVSGGGGVQVGAKGSTTLGSVSSSNTLILIVVVAAVLLFIAMRK
jgi:hypothetical protein